MTGDVLNWLFSLHEVASIESVELVLTAGWLRRGAFWIVLGIVASLLAVVWHYRTYQHRGSLGMRTLLGLLRGTVLGLLLLTLALPALRLRVRETHYPTVYWVFDGTASMQLRDNLSETSRNEFEQTLGAAQESSPADSLPPSRMEYLQRWLERRQGGSLVQAMIQSQVPWEAFLFDGRTTSRLRRLSQSGSTLPELGSRLTATGQVTALGAVLRDLAQQPGAGNLGAVVLFSDFANNSGPSPLAADQQSALATLGVPVHTVGIGPRQTVDLHVSLQADAKLKRGEETQLVVHVQQSGLDQAQAVLTVTAQRSERNAAGELAEPISLKRQELRLGAADQLVRVPFVPQQSGEWELTAAVEQLPGEVIWQNNRSERQVTVIEDHLRLLYVAHEPTWEWRFIKEVFYRDELVGSDGFRTFLESSDPQVRRRNQLFLGSLTPAPSEFFRNDVILLGDVPETLLTDRFGEMVEHFVGRLGGGLVVIAGPRFGPARLAGSPINQMLPVYLERDSELQDNQFELQLTPQAAHFAFMQLPADGQSDRTGWDNLGPLPWYQPVAAVHPQATVLAEHPTHVCRDGTTRQPLIAVRRYGNGEVFYIGFNETWRMRRGYGERFYRQFWSQLIYRLGMSHAIGAEKRFVVRTDRRQYRVGDELALSIEAYDENYEPLEQADLPPQGLIAEIMPAGGAEPSLAVALPLIRDGLLETRFPLAAAGRFHIRVIDPVTGRPREHAFQVSDASAEQQSAVRNVGLQREISRLTGGQVHELSTADQLADALALPPTIRHETRVRSLWNTPFWFMLLIGLMLCEWFGRRLVDLR